MKTILKFSLGLTVGLLLTYGAYTVPEWTGLLNSLDPNGQTPWFLQWFLGLAEIFLALFFLVGCWRIGEELWEMIF